MILHDLFEGKMSELDIEYQDFLNRQGKHGMSDQEFQDAYGMTRTEWAKKNKKWTWQKERLPVAPDAHLFHEESLNELAPGNGDQEPNFNPEMFYDIPKLKKVSGQLTSRSVNPSWYDLQIKVLIGYMEEMYMITSDNLDDMFPTAPQIANYIERNIIKAFPSNEPPYIIKNPDYKPRAPRSPQQGIAETSAKDRWVQSAKERQEKHDKIERKRQEAAKQGKTDVSGAIRRLEKALDKEQLDELQFLGSECTKDCSGHRAGYNWSKKQGGVDGMSPWSPSFNKGAALAKAGK